MYLGGKNKLFSKLTKVILGLLLALTVLPINYVNAEEIVIPDLVWTEDGQIEFAANTKDTTYYATRIYIEGNDSALNSANRFNWFTNEDKDDIYNIAIEDLISKFGKDGTNRYRFSVQYYDTGYQRYF